MEERSLFCDSSEGCVRLSLSVSFTVAMKGQSRWARLENPQVYYAGATLMLLGSLFVLSSFMALGVTGTFLGAFTPPRADLSSGSTAEIWVMMSEERGVVINLTIHGLFCMCNRGAVEGRVTPSSSKALVLFQFHCPSTPAALGPWHYRIMFWLDLNDCILLRP
ncbi:hypothetical protein DNTS_025259 [Danionella cerebrum]|uniref:Uncharacterized protein n=1 Tax=Danionella cerebrum TaxID=2873325 RepID=A0A553Q1H1_9TELE|nr:hypothetical protein DNTS_025259 [Danionella translucida]